MKKFTGFCVILVAVSLLSLLAAGCDSTSPGKIAFVSNFEDPGHYDAACIMEPDGSNRLKLGECTALFTRWLQWSPDGRRIAFCGPQMEICIADADGTNVRRVKLSTMGYYLGGGPSWSPDGAKIAAAGAVPLSTYPDVKACDIYTIDVETSEVKKLTDTPDISKFEPLWSPGGRQIAFWNDDGIYVIEANGSNQRLLVSGPSLQQISWSPNGKKIMYVSRAAEKGYGEIYLVDVEDGTTINLTNSPDIHDCDPAWSPDGKRIAFCSGEYDREQIYIMNADGSNKVRLTDEELKCHGPSWSPDGKKVVFSAGPVSRPGGEVDGRNRWTSIFVVDIDSHTVTDLIASGPGNYERPVWSPG